MEEGTWSLTEDLPWMVSFHEIGETVSAEDQTEVQPEQPSDQGPEPDREALSFTYPYAAACEAPTKLTATQLKGREKDQEIAENSFQPYVRRSLAAPRFLSGKLPADGGGAGYGSPSGDAVSAFGRRCGHRHE